MIPLLGCQDTLREESGQPHAHTLHSAPNNLAKNDKQDSRGFASE
jgi:hypothetical protein